MDFSYILNKAVPNLDKFKNYGFIRNGKKYSIKKNLDEDFYVTVTMVLDSAEKQKIVAEVFEIESDEKYALLDVESANGNFVGDLRKKVKDFMDEVQKNCFLATELTERYEKWILESFGASPEYPWEGSTTDKVFRCPNGKWLALIMKIPLKKLGINSEEKVDVVNLKANEKDIPNLVDGKSIFPAWHMSKKYWITVLLTTVTDFEKLCELTNCSYNLVMKK